MIKVYYRNKPRCQPFFVYRRGLPRIRLSSQSLRHKLAILKIYCQAKMSHAPDRSAVRRTQSLPAAEIKFFRFFYLPSKNIFSRTCKRPRDYVDIQFGRSICLGFITVSQLGLIITCCIKISTRDSAAGAPDGVHFCASEMYFGIFT